MKAGCLLGGERDSKSPVLINLFSLEKNRKPVMFLTINLRTIDHFNYLKNSESHDYEPKLNLAKKKKDFHMYFRPITITKNDEVKLLR